MMPFARDRALHGDPATKKRRRPRPMGLSAAGRALAEASALSESSEHAGTIETPRIVPAASSRPRAKSRRFWLDVTVRG